MILLKVNRKGVVVIMEFVICDDEKRYRTIERKIIDKLLINNDSYYHVTEFEKFDNDFKKLVKTGKSKIYILDIEMKEGLSGLDIAREIRKKDWESVIILVTSHNELGFEALKSQIMLLDFISKYDNCEASLEKAIKRAISQVNNKKTLTFSSDGISYLIHLDDIIYIMKDTVDRKCIIKTVYNEIAVNKTINYILGILDDRFYLTHRSCIVNTEKISKIDWKENVIYFETGDFIDVIAREKRKGLKEYVRS